MSDDPFVRLAATGVRSARIDLDEALGDIEESLEHGRVPNAQAVTELRDALELALTYCEDDLADAVNGTEPWERPPNMPYKALWRLMPDE